MGGPIDAPDDTVIWRYMDLARFVVMFARGEVRFTKLEKLLADVSVRGYRTGEGTARPMPKRMPKDAAMAIYSMASSYAAKTIRNAPKHVYVNSWCAFHESMAMWQVYGSSGGGVAIRSTVGRFRSALVQNLRKEQYAFGLVSYELDPKAKPGDDLRRGSVPLSGNLWKLVLSKAYNKRTTYHFESEWRAAIFQEQLRPEIAGLEVPTKLDQLVEAVFVGPRAGSVVLAAVNEVVTRSGLSKPVTRSTLLDSP